MINFEIISDEKYNILSWNPVHKILKTEWNTPIDMDEELYRSVVLEHLNTTKKYAPTRMLVDTQNAYYNVVPETQDWINQKFVKIVEEIKLEKMAWIVSEDFFAQVSFDQVMDDASEASPFQMKHFTNSQEALEWLLIE
ncbi:STAS/SEC14 domain-containing protein [Flammeovirga kamogawensis]|uniref:STAS/SEC14 domain-containing protein n=1 Tax=Flammeovirga kamogawensis TaxID=373891 RepID=A0ABX8H268_9BACT|nr:STAS/SEC14 domain-containing protein [Flammeovirga kamogawensis]MBB6460187.1 hypothetical protein [Flammeovirga kamogawensis]QWG09999.1 STAS/SEC14 domain-containing protein [Flammeovirga kamogawensis]TRX65507.1 hypothetical protein EO216_23595 [Flammeovirga kamogawensis]